MYSANSDFTINLQGTASGSFDLDVHEVSGNTVTASSTFAVIPSATTTKASISFHRGGIETASPLTVDFNGDGKHMMSFKGRRGETIVPDSTPKKVREFLEKRGHRVTSPHEDREAGIDTRNDDKGKKDAEEGGKESKEVNTQNDKIKEGTNEAVETEATTKSLTN